jgi:methyl-accepting chemotaxis protein
MGKGMALLKKMKITYKTLLIGGLVIGLLLAIAGYLFTQSETQMVEDIQNADAKRAEASIDQLLAEEKIKLQQRLEFNGNVLSQIAGPILYNLSNMEQPITSFLRVPEVEGILIFDSEGNENYSAGWKENTQIKLGTGFPESFKSGDFQLLSFPINYSGKKIGETRMYYSTALLESKSALLKQDAKAAQLEARKAIDKALNSAIASQFIGFLVIIIITLGVFAVILRSFVVSPIQTVIEAIKEIAQGGGDLTQRIPVDTKDELGELSNWFNVFIEHIEGVVREISLSSKDVTSSAQEMVDVSSNLVAISNEVTQQSITVAGATEELSTNIDTTASATEEMSVNVASVSSTAEEMSSNMNTVAAATEEMSQAIRHIAENAREGAEVANKAQAMATEATSTMSTLGEAASEIGQVTEVIKRIAEQTNLLALNATIEAASAGDAGKGFAVVANEIKELANQSAKAAEDISSRIEGVQQNSTQAVSVIENITNIIAKMNEEVMMISNSVEQQTSTANEIASNVAEANIGVNNIASSIGEVAAGSNEVARSTQESSKATAEVSENIAGISASIRDTDRTVGAVNALTEKLSDISQSLNIIVGKFKISAEAGANSSVMMEPTPAVEEAGSEEVSSDQ